MTWRWASTPSSAEHGQISILEIVESVAAVSISLGIAWYYKTVDHIAFSACLAPMLLLSSKRSVLLGIYLANKRSPVILNLWKIVLPPFAFLIARIVAVSCLFLDRPLYSINRIPDNWRRIVFCTDIMCPSEVIPGIENEQYAKLPIFERFFQQYNELRLNETVRIIRDMTLDTKDDLHLKDKSKTLAWIFKFFMWPIFLGFLFLTLSPVFVIGYGLSIVYRWSLKSASIIWSPLLWVIVSARTVGPIQFRLRQICNLAMYKAMRVYSAFVVLLFLWKMVLLLGWTELAAILQDTRISELVTPYIAPTQLPLWQIGAALNSLLAWALYFLADMHLSAIESGSPNRSSEATIKAQIAAITVIRNTLALYTIACTLYITWQIAADIEWPVIEIVLFPWSP